MKRVLCIHGIGGKDATVDQWSGVWKNAFRNLSGPGPDLKFHFLKIDDLFIESKDRMGGIKYFEAIRQFISGWLNTITEEKFAGVEFLDSIRWVAGMPAQFATDEILRKNLQKRLEKSICDFRPDLVYAHSLGSLILYDLLCQKSASDQYPELMALTSGSQIAHPAIRQLFGDAILPLKVKCWINLHNENDRVFASRPVPLKSGNFLQVETPFLYGMLHHEALQYLDHQNTVTQAWPYARTKYAPHWINPSVILRCTNE